MSPLRAWVAAHPGYFVFWAVALVTVAGCLGVLIWRAGQIVALLRALVAK